MRSILAGCRRRPYLGSALVLLVLGLAALGQPGREPPVRDVRFEPPKPGEILPRFMLQRLALKPDQEKQIAELQKDVDAKLAKILTAEQKKTLADRPGPGFGPPGPFGGPGGMPPGGGPVGGFQIVGMDEIKKAIDATDEEWKVIGPKVQKINAARQVLASDSRPSEAKAAAADDQRPAGDARRPGRAGSSEDNAMIQVHADFKAVLDDPKHTKAQLLEAAEDIRRAREKVRGDLRALQKDLRQLLAAEQETILTRLGYLD